MNIRFDFIKRIFIKTSFFAKDWTEKYLKMQIVSIIILRIKSLKYIYELLKVILQINERLQLEISFICKLVGLLIITSFHIGLNHTILIKLIFWILRALKMGNTNISTLKRLKIKRQINLWTKCYAYWCENKFFQQIT